MCFLISFFLIVNFKFYFAKVLVWEELDLRKFKQNKSKNP